MIPLVDLKTQHDSIRTQIDAAIGQVIDACQFVRGPQLAAFERSFAEFCRTRHAIGTSSGTSSIQLVLMALGIGPGDEVIIPAHTFVASAEPIAAVGARIVLADVDPQRYTLDPSAVADLISRRTRAIIAVHLYGQMSDMPGLQAVIDRSGQDIHLIEDAAQAHGARLNNRSAGSIGIAGCFSFYPGKNLGAFGDAGAVTTNDDALAERIRMLADHGRTTKYRHDLIGGNHRLDTLQAAVLSVKLAHLDRWNARRQSRAALYNKLLTDVAGVETPHVASGSEHVYHLYVIQNKHRDELADELRQRGISTGLHYPIALQEQPALTGADMRCGPLPVTTRLVDRILSLPMYPDLTDDSVASVAGAISAFKQTTRLAAV